MEIQVKTYQNILKRVEKNAMMDGIGEDQILHLLKVKNQVINKIKTLENELENTGNANITQ